MATIPYKLPPLGAQGDSNKWNLPGWRIEQRFVPGVLIGNWYENRREFEPGPAHGFPTTQGTEYPAYPNAQPDVTIRRKNVVRRRGLPKERIFFHHGDHKYPENNVTLYDEKYNGREHREGQLPETRSWDRHKLAWAPEKSDFPLQAPATKFGLAEKKRRQWAEEAEVTDLGEWTPSTRAQFPAPPTDALVRTHHAAPRVLSSHLLAFNQINRFLDLRGVPARQAPDSLVIPVGKDAAPCECVQGVHVCGKDEKV